MRLINSAVGDGQVNHDTTASSQPRRVFASCGLAVLTGLTSVLLIALTILFPPWLEVHCERRQILFASHRVKVHETSFSGFDYIFAKSKWEVLLPKHGNGELFESVEYGLHWRLLIGEWITIVVVVGICYATLLMKSANPRRSEQSHAPEPANGPNPNGESLPSAR